MFKQCAASLLEMPAELVQDGFSLRPESPDDYSFLERLYISVREDELRPVEWPDEFKLQFLISQFKLQHAHYAERYRGCHFHILERAGTPMGRLYLFHGAADIRIVDISLLAEVRNAGIGGALLRAVLAAAAATGKTTSIHVEKFNPAQRLYRRLGFREVEEHGPYWLMEAKPGSETFDAVGG